jgi:surfeit locus 1 family protein
MTFRRVPLGLTLAAALAFAVMIGLGLWQVRRFQWKERVLAQIAALRTAPAQPIGPVLVRAARGEDVEFLRVVADCRAPAIQPPDFQMTTDQGDWIARALAACPLAAGPFDGVLVDRGLLQASRGQPNPPTAVLPPPGRVVGVLRRADRRRPLGVRRSPGYLLVAERETPPAPGVTPSQWAGQAPGNLQYVGEYAPTWFGLAGVLAAFYAALLWRRLRS